MKFQRLADAAKMEHMKKYPEYKYRPRRTHEKRRRTKRPSSSLTNGNNANKSSNNNDNAGTTTPNTNNNECPSMDTSPLLNSISTSNDLPFLNSSPVDRRSSIDTVSTIDYYDESRRGSIISCGDINDLEYGNNEFNDYDQITLFDDVSSSMVEEPAQLQYPVTSSCSTSNSPQQYNVCVENTAAFDLMMGDVSPGNDSDVNVNQYDFFGFGYPGYFNSSPFDYSLMSSPNDQMMSCETLAHIDA